MKPFVPQIGFIDSTLREGYQSAVSLFRPDIPPARYAEKIIGSVQAEYVEIYGPEFYYSKEDYESLVEILGSRLQLYCGPVDRFNPSTKAHINDLGAPRLSLTVIEKSSVTINKLKNILKLYPGSTLRLGMECAGTTDTEFLTNFLLELSSMDRVANITLSDSNGKMTPPALRKLIMNLPSSFSCTLGFHLHNDQGLAVANALTAIDASDATGFKNIAFDYTYAGLGERYGLLSLQESIILKQRLINGNVEDVLKDIDPLFTDDALHFHRLPFMKEVVHVAESHFDTNGQLRQEYRTSISKGGSNGK